MLEVKNLTIEIGLKIIIRDLNFNIYKNDKLAIIGEEGNGKSTLLKAILGNVDYANISGEIIVKGSIGYLEQAINEESQKKSVYNYLFDGNEDYYNKVNNLYKYLKLLTIKEDLLNRNRISDLSGGEKVKIQLLKILLNDCDILLLDEPTNDLDIETLEWLESFINNTSTPIIYVSHDETLLENTANRILHLELVKKKTECKWTIDNIGYAEYVEKRLHNLVRTSQIAKKERDNYHNQLERLTQVMNKVHHQQDNLTPKDPHQGKMLKRKMKSLKAQERRLGNTELTEIPDFEKEINLFFNNISLPNGKKIIDIKNYSLEVNGNVLVNNINLEVYGPMKIVIVGTNGIGKTTLLNYIYKELENRDDLKVGYMSQNYDNILNGYKTPIDFLANDLSKNEISSARTLMGNMHFTKEEMTGSLNDLSGGSKAKLILLKLVKENYNVLILDEPTRNVSPLSNPVIREALKNYNGCIISVSHDRKYIKTVCNELYELNKKGLLKK